MAFNMENRRRWDAEERKKLNEMLGADRAKRFLEKIKKLTGYDTDKCCIFELRIADSVKRAIDEGVPYIYSARYDDDGDLIDIKIYF